MHAQAEICVGNCMSIDLKLIFDNIIKVYFSDIPNISGITVQSYRDGFEMVLHIKYWQPFYSGRQTDIETAVSIIREQYEIVKNKINSYKELRTTNPTNWTSLRLRGIK